MRSASIRTCHGVCNQCFADGMACTQNATNSEADKASEEPLYGQKLEQLKAYQDQIRRIIERNRYHPFALKRTLSALGKKQLKHWREVSSTERVSLYMKTAVPLVRFMYLA